jgi:hypothetical protein
MQSTQEHERITAKRFAIIHSTGTLVEEFRAIVEMMVEGWFHYAALGAILSVLTNNLLLERASLTLSSSIGDKVWKEAKYGWLFLRLVLPIPTEESVVDQVRMTSRSQALAMIETVRLNSFVLCLVATLAIIVLSCLQPLLLATWKTLLDIASLDDWRVWPLKWQPL